MNASHAATKRPRLSERHVLIVDEQPQSLRFLHDLCRSLGALDIRGAGTAEQALSVLEQERFDIVICLWCPSLDAAELTKRIRHNDARHVQRVRIVLLRSEATVTDVIAARDCGADEFVAMPLSLGSFEGALHRVTTRPQHFVEMADYRGPCRRRRRLIWETERRKVEASVQARTETM
jgi:DNA-binding response OmpR family regulator